MQCALGISMSEGTGTCVLGQGWGVQGEESGPWDVAEV